MYHYGYIRLFEGVHLLHSRKKLTLRNTNGVYFYISKNRKVLLKIQWIFAISLILFLSIRNVRGTCLSAFPLRCATAQLRSATKPFAQWNIILAHMQRFKFHSVYKSHRPFTAWNGSLVVIAQGCASACALKQRFAQCKVFLEGRLMLACRNAKGVHCQRKVGSASPSRTTRYRFPLLLRSLGSTTS